MKRFILLLNHDDTSLTGYLQHCMDRGESFVSASGNIFTFRKAHRTGDRIAAVTYTGDESDLKMKFQLEDYAALMKKKGWHLIHTGAPEDIFDSKRHVFLLTDQPDIPLPLGNPIQAEKAAKREVRSLIRCIAMLLLLAGFVIFFLSHDPDIFLSSAHIIIPSVLGFLFWLVSLFFWFQGTVTVNKKAQSANNYCHYLSVDKAVLFCMLAAGALLAALMADLFLFPNTSKVIVSGDQRITVYQDTVPLSLENAGIPAAGKYRSSRFTERNSFLMESIYGSDQSYSDPNGVEDLSLIAYSVFRSDQEHLLDWVISRKGLTRLPVSAEFAERWHSTEVHTDEHHRLSAIYPGTLLIFSSSADLTEIDPDTVLEALGIELKQAD